MSAYKGRKTTALLIKHNPIFTAKKAGAKEIALALEVVKSILFIDGMVHCDSP